jgi:hypothetical protein
MYVESKKGKRLPNFTTRCPHWAIDIFEMFGPGSKDLMV